MDMEEKTLRTGLISEKVDSRDALASSFFKSEAVLPKEFTLTRPSATHLQVYGSCVGEAASRIVEYANAKEGENQHQSARYVYAECKKQDGHPEIEGTWLNIGIDILAKMGACKYEDYPHVTPYSEYMKDPNAEIDARASIYRINGYVRFNNNTETALIKKYILEYGLPVLTGSSGSNNTWTSTAVKNNGYVIPEYTNAEWSHAIVIVGWNEQGWIIENSWSDDWGNKGRAVLPYGYKGIFNYSYCGYDLPNYWKEIDNMWKQTETIKAFWNILEEIGHPVINEKDMNIHMKAKTPEEFVIGFKSVFKQLREHIGEEETQKFMEKMGWK